MKQEINRKSTFVSVYISLIERNCHIKFRKDIMLALNVVAGRLLGWVIPPIKRQRKWRLLNAVQNL